MELSLEGSTKIQEKISEALNPYKIKQMILLNFVEL